VTVALPASNIAVVEQRAEVLIAGRPAAPGEQAAGWPPSPGSLAGDITAAIMREVPDYAQSDDPDVARVVRRVAREAVAGLSARVAQPGAAVTAASAAPLPVAPPLTTGGPAGSAEAAVPVFRDLGRLLALEGRSLGALQAALRVGARVTWQRLHEQARQGNGTPAEFARAGETVFWYMDELAAACSAGYAEARAELSGETSQLRRHLLDLLTASSAPPLPAIAGLAQASGWPLPRRVAAVALSPLAARRPGMLPPDMLADLTRRDPCLLIPDPDGPGRRTQVATALRGWLTAAGQPGAGPLAAVGPAVPLTAASGSLRWAGQALALARRGLVRARDDTAGDADDPASVVWCEDHLPTLVLLADPDLAATLSREALAPLRPLRPGQADRLARTLLAWIENADDANAAARRLRVHPQTVRYRLRQASELFGDALTDPDARFRLLLALRVRRLLGG